jgi:hypothetical protein
VNRAAACRGRPSRRSWDSSRADMQQSTRPGRAEFLRGSYWIYQNDERAYGSEHRKGRNPYPNRGSESFTHEHVEALRAYPRYQLISGLRNAASTIVTRPSQATISIKPLRTMSISERVGPPRYSLRIPGEPVSNPGMARGVGLRHARGAAEQAQSKHRNMIKR